MRDVSIKLAVLIGLLLVAPASAHTCRSFRSYSDSEFRTFLENSSAIFFGEVVSFEPPTNSYTQKVHIRVSRVWKGVDDRDVSVVYEGAYEPFEVEIGGVGTQKVFYAGSTPEGELRTSFCGFQTGTDERMRFFFGGRNGNPPKSGQQEGATIFFHLAFQNFHGALCMNG